jgi:hypothetical protein
VCDVGGAERRKRFQAALLAFAAAAVFTAWVAVDGRPTLSLPGTVLVLTFGVLGVLQARMGFCVAFGAMAQYDPSGAGGGTGTASGAELRRKDRRRAFEITAYALVLGFAVTMLASVLVAGPLAW